MKNVTVSMDEETARWVRVYAAKKGKSVSRWLSELVEEYRREQEGYDLAMQRYLTRERSPIRTPGERLPSRDEIHDRKASQESDRQ